MIKKFVQRLLASQARRVLTAYRPTVVAITGSVGKTTTKHAVAHVLRAHHTVLESPGNLNTDIGMPLSILELKAPTSPLGWATTIAKALLYKPETYPQILVLEFGIDHPGDMKELAAIAPPSIVIETGVDQVHMEFFPSHDALIQEKASLLSYLPADGLAILNADNQASYDMRSHAGAWQRVTFGTDARAEIRAESVSMTLDGISFTTSLHGENPVTVHSPVIGIHHVGALLAALIVANRFSIPLHLAAKDLASFTLPPGRLNKIDGQNGTTIIDSSYNAEPASVRAAIQTLSSLPAKRRVAILGDMLELGSSEIAQHKDLLDSLATLDVVIFVGPLMHYAYEEWVTTHSNAYYFDTSTDGAKEILDYIQKGDLILVKGSQGARMERITKALMARPNEAVRLLVRQSRYWEHKK